MTQFEKMIRRYIRRKMWKKAWKPFWATILIMSIICIIAYGAWWIYGNITFTTSNNANELYKVEYVKDGDTIVCNIDGESVTVRMIGIDTPESVHSDETKNVPQGDTASAYTKSLLEGKKVYLEYDIDKTDDYGRTLAYVYLEDNTMVNSLLLEKGYAETMMIAPNVKYALKFSGIEAEAKKNNVGFWDGYFD